MVSTYLSICLCVCELDISKSCGRLVTKRGGRVVSLTRTSRFDFGSGLDSDQTYQWDTKCKLFSLAEICKEYV